MSLQRYKFGIGSVFACRTDIANPTPIKICDIQEASVTIKAKIVKGRGQKLYSVALARAEEDMTGKLKFLRQDPSIAAGLYHGVSLNLGQITLADSEATTCAATVAVANHATYLYDNGVINAVNGSTFTRVNAAPITGQYTSDGSGNYVFSAADIAAAVPVLISYGYSVTGSGYSYTVTNGQSGISPVFQLALHNVYNSPTGLQTDDMLIYAVQASSYNEGGKNGEFCTPEVDWEAQEGPSGKIYSRSVNGVAI